MLYKKIKNKGIKHSYGNHGDPWMDKKFQVHIDKKKDTGAWDILDIVISVYSRNFLPR